MSKTVKQYTFCLDPVEDQEIIAFLEEDCDGEFPLEPGDEQQRITELLTRGLEHFHQECEAEEVPSGASNEQ